MKADERVLTELALDEIHFDGQSRALSTRDWREHPETFFGNQNRLVFTRQEFAALLAAIWDGSTEYRIQQVNTRFEDVRHPTGSMAGLYIRPDNNEVWLRAYQLVNLELAFGLKQVNIRLLDAVRCENLDDLIEMMKDKYRGCLPTNSLCDSGEVDYVKR